MIVAHVPAPCGALSKPLEKSLWRWLSQARKTLGPLLHMERVENCVGMGHPDVVGCYDGVDFQIELKTAARPARPTTLIKTAVQPSQVIWAKKRSDANGSSAWLLIQVGAGTPPRLAMMTEERMRLLGTTGLTLQACGIECALPTDVIHRAVDYL